MPDVLPDGIPARRGVFKIKKEGVGSFLTIRCEVIEIRRNARRTIDEQETYCGVIISPGRRSVSYTIRGIYDMTADKFTDIISDIEDSDEKSNYEWYPEGEVAGTPVFSGLLLVQDHNIVAATPGNVVADVVLSAQDDLRDVAS